MVTIIRTLEHLRQAGWQQIYPTSPRVTIGMATCGRAAGAPQVHAEFQRRIESDHLPVELAAVGCAGMCWAEPQVEIQLPGFSRAVYGGVKPEQVTSLLQGLSSGSLPEQGLLGWIDEDWYPALDRIVQMDPVAGPNLADHPYLASQTRLISSSWGHIQPWSASEYAATGGYEALDRALHTCQPDELIDTIEASGLRGRGGAGFLAGRKWWATRNGRPGVRYVIANADEGDPGAYMDRGLLESDPHRVLEGLALAAYAIGASQGYIFTRSEYPLAIATLERAIAEAEEYGLLGEDILGSSWSFRVGIVRSAGAYVCGEETAMIRAIEGYRGDPRSRPPYPAERGLWGAPTCVNNVETLANVPFILLRGPDWFRQFGTANSPGTKIFSLVGSIDRPGLIEVPMGTSMRTVVDDIGGHATDQPRAFQIGGPSGAILPPSLGELPLDYEGLAEVGGIMGSGGIVILGQRACVVDTARYFVNFSVQESCGKCTACRDGLVFCLAILDKVCSGQAQTEDMEELERLCEYIATNSLCGLGKMAPRPVITSLRYFRDEYAAHLGGHCPGFVCKALIHFEVIAAKCPGCRCCLPTCPTNAMQGRFGKPYTIVQRLCDKCWMCTYTCSYNAIQVY